jgi:hypothetical protein
MKGKVPHVMSNSAKPKKKRKKDATKANAPRKKSATTSIKDFPDGCFWKQLVPSSTANKPTNPTFAFARAPTVPEDEADNVTIKWDFAEKFSRPMFQGQHQKSFKLRNGQQKMNKETGSPVTDSLLQKKRMPDPEFAKKQKLSVDSTPTEFVKVFIPCFLNPCNGKPNPGRVHPSIQTWTEWTNQKAMLACAGKAGATSESRESHLCCPLTLLDNHTQKALMLA